MHRPEANFQSDVRLFGSYAVPAFAVLILLVLARFAACQSSSGSGCSRSNDVAAWQNAAIFPRVVSRD
jgi:hypothetical protein